MCVHVHLNAVNPILGMLLPEDIGCQIKYSVQSVGIYSLNLLVRGVP